jgi:hypothetical protein
MALDLAKTREEHYISGRRERNRLAAKNSRLRKAKYTQILEDKLERARELWSERVQPRLIRCEAQNAFLTQENERLSKRVAELENLLFRSETDTVDELLFCS